MGTWKARSRAILRRDLGGCEQLWEAGKKNVQEVEDCVVGAGLGGREQRTVCISIRLDGFGKGARGNVVGFAKRTLRVMCTYAA